MGSRLQSTTAMFRFREYSQNPLLFSQTIDAVIAAKMSLFRTRIPVDDDPQRADTPRPIIGAEQPSADSNRTTRSTRRTHPVRRHRSSTGYEDDLAADRRPEDDATRRSTHRAATAAHQGGFA